MKKAITATAILSGVALAGFIARPYLNVHKVEAKVVEAPKAQVIEQGDLDKFTVRQPERFQLVEVEQRADIPKLEVNGVVSADVSRNVPVLSLTGGRVVEIHARLGDTVEKGQRLLRIHSPDLSAAFADYEKSKADLVLAREQMDRSQLLFDKGVLAKKDLQAAVDALAKAEVDAKTSAERIRILGADIGASGPFVDIQAPANGVITEQNVTAGTAVRSTDNSPNLFTIADLSHVWVLCDVYENDLAKVTNGAMAEIRVNAFPDRVFRGRVSNISPQLDPQTRSAKVRIELENPDRTLRPNMFAVARFTLPQQKTVEVVPATAIMHLHDRAWVFVAEGNGQFRRVEVQVTGTPTPGTEELTGVDAGSKIVANALQFSTALDLANDEEKKGSDDKASG